MSCPGEPACHPKSGGGGKGPWRGTVGKAGNPSPCRGRREEVGSVVVGEGMGCVVRLASTTWEFGDFGHQVT